MPKLRLDDIEYNTEDLSERGQATLKSLQFLEHQLQKMRNEIAIYNTAKRAYVSALESEIRDNGIEPVDEEQVPIE
tara:strand:- start:64 stop:291 length:228 start_codon:yes stop_codon:yes gene_type:complete